MSLKKFILGLSLLVTGYSVSAQQHVCGTHPTAESIQQLKENKANIKAIQPRFATRYIPVTFHLVGDNNGDQRLLYSAALNQLCKMNKDYASLDMVFYLKDGGFNLIDNNGIFFNPNLPGNILKIVDNKSSDALNIFVCENADTGGNGPGTTLGFYTYSNDYVIVRKNELVDTSSTISHEVGHFFSLAHPHQGWEDEPWSVEQYGTTVTVTSVGSSQTGQSIPVELVDGSNCDESGDYVCDTPPDYNFGFTSPGCNFVYEVYDRNNDQIFPMADNYMGYFNSCLNYVFTAEQGQLMSADFDSNRRSYLRSDYVPNIEEVKGPVVLNSPASNSELEGYNGVLLDWEPVENADKYLVEISAGSQTLSYFTDTDELFVTDLDPDTYYFWIIKPFNETSACVTSASFLFKTGNTQSATNEIEGIENVSFYPNPIIENQQAFIQFESNIAREISLELTDLTGKKLYTKQINVAAGVNNIAVETKNIQMGTYFVIMKTENGRMTQKVVIQ